MRYDEAANFLLDLQRYRPRAGTDATASLLSALSDPHEGPRYVQVAGSNGKGSTARMLERVLREAGLDVGLYTSPHFDDLRERVRVNGRLIPKSAVAAFARAAKSHVVDAAAGGRGTTFFETMTAMALWHFGREDVDVAILEVGIGGKFDATSVVDPEAAAVTSVTLEHTSVLGDTVEEIAADKAHVAPNGNPLVTATTGDALDAVRAQAGDVLTVGPAGDVRTSYGGAVSPIESLVAVETDGFAVETRLPLVGEYQATNAGVAVALARQLADVDEEAVERGLRGATWPGRFEVMGREPLVVLDGAHNPGACEALADTLAEFADDYDDFHLVLGAMNDKDHDAMADALPTPSSLYTCMPATQRAEDRDVLARVFEEHGVDDVHAMASVEAAVDRAVEAADANDLVLVTGSLYAVAEARTRWTRLFTEKTVDDLDDAADALESADVTPPGVWRMRGKGVHRVVRTRVQKRQASFLKEEMLSLGGECAISGLNAQVEGNLDVALMGTLAQFKRLCAKLDGQPYGLSVLARDLRDSLGIGVAEKSEPQYPWEDEGTAVMGILNCTPDSFHDGGEYAAVEDAVARAEEMVEAGADIVDVGGESTRPGAEPVPTEVEIDRIVPVIERVHELDCLISVDTMKAEVGRAALEAGADILNDVTGLEDPEMRFVAAEYDAPIVVMHSLHAPVEPDEAVEYDDVVDDVIAELRERVLLAEKAGVPREKVIVDPGIGFGKSTAENFELLQRTDEFHALGCPVLIGHSHKSMWEAADSYPDEGGYATVAGTAIAADRGADIVRVHDVQENVAAVRAVDATKKGADADEE